MAVYAIGDVQGCDEELGQLLERLRFKADRDRLWFVGVKMLGESFYKVPVPLSLGIIAGILTISVVISMLRPVPPPDAPPPSEG